MTERKSKESHGNSTRREQQIRDIPQHALISYVAKYLFEKKKLDIPSRIHLTPHTATEINRNDPNFLGWYFKEAASHIVHTCEFPSKRPPSVIPKSMPTHQSPHNSNININNNNNSNSSDPNTNANKNNTKGECLNDNNGVNSSHNSDSDSNNNDNDNNNKINVNANDSTTTSNNGFANSNNDNNSNNHNNNTNTTSNNRSAPGHSNSNTNGGCNLLSVMKGKTRAQQEHILRQVMIQGILTQLVRQGWLAEDRTGLIIATDRCQKKVNRIAEKALEKQKDGGNNNNNNSNDKNEDKNDIIEDISGINCSDRTNPAVNEISENAEFKNNNADENEGIPCY